MATLFVNETYVNEDKGYQFGESGWQESFTDNMGRLFRSCQKEYGRCTSAVYVDTVDGPPIRVGWYFQKRMEYEDSRPRYDSYSGKMKPAETYLRGVWVTVREAVTIECSNCGHEWEGLARSACPECGARPIGRALTETEEAA
jgi:predicted RNA-binding Zn-ribbon protein involved in translation (DUF1610 family)